MERRWTPENCWFLSGPTASGKTAVGLRLAERLGGEIVSLDSMALYRGMDIGTAKPSAEERRTVRHHLIDVIEPADEYSVAQYVDAARHAVDQIAGRGAVPLFVGGTALYLKVLLRGMFVGPPADWPLRRRLMDEAEAAGPEPLHARLAAVDPQAAARLHPRDLRRVIRALEVYEKTGQAISHWQRQFALARKPAECRVFVLDWPRQTLGRRIDERVEAMFAAGLVEEVRGLLAAERPPGRTASQAVGYREVIEHLRGVRDLIETIALVKLRTRQFAKRQMTWFRSLPECRFVAMEAGREPGEVAGQIEAG